MRGATPNPSPHSNIKKYWLRLATHIFRLDQETPSWRAMKSYFTKDAICVRGRPKTTIVDTLAAQLKELAIPLKNIKDLASAAGLASDKRNWKDCTK